MVVLACSPSCPSRLEPARSQGFLITADNFPNDFPNELFSESRPDSATPATPSAVCGRRAGSWRQKMPRRSGPLAASTEGDDG